MKIKKIFLFVILVVFIHTSVKTQPFIQQKKGQPLTFKEMQRQYNDWAKKHDLKQTHYWKYFKRWENEMQMHTNAQGEPGDASIYLNESIKKSQEKQTLKNNKFLSSAWYPSGPYMVPENMTGYMENGIGRINCIAFHPTDTNTYFVGVAQGGVWKTTNNGLSWTPLTDNLPILRISDISIDPNSPNTMYISVCDFAYIDVALNIDGRKRNTHYGLGVYKTTDGGFSWFPTGLTFQQIQGDASLIRKIIINPDNSNQLVASGVGGIYKSMDGGNSWSQILDTLFWDLVQDPLVPTTLYAASGWLFSSNYGYASIYKSTDFGSTWTELNTGIPHTGAVQRIKIAISPSDNTYIYALCVDDNDGFFGIYQSTDAGMSWNYINTGVNILDWDNGTSTGGQGTYDLALAVNPSNKNIIYVGGINVWSSADGGQTFLPVAHWTLSYGPTVHADIHFIETQPSTGNIFVCNDGGLYKTRNIVAQTWDQAYNGSPWPTQWTNVSNGMQVTSFYRLSSDKTNTGRLIAGAQDNGSIYFDGNNWHTVFGGDGMDNFLDPFDTNFILGSCQYGTFCISFDNGNSCNYFMITSDENCEWTTPLIADYNQPNTLYAGCTNVYRSDDNGYSWYPLSPLPSNGIYDNEIAVMAVAYTNSNVIYVARRIRYEYNSPANVYKTNNGGNSWIDITSNLPDSLYITSIDVSQTDENTVFVTFAGFTENTKVYKTTDGGLTWQNISYNLPNIPVNCIKTIPANNTLVIATDIGIYILDNVNNLWINQSSNLPNVIISDIEFNESLDKIYISTFGRGIWETELSSLVKINEVHQLKFDIELFPNPNNGTFTITMKEPSIQNEFFNLEIIDITGKKICNTKLSGKNKYSIRQPLLPGLYFAKIYNTNFSGIRNFIVE